MKKITQFVMMLSVMVGFNTSSRAQGLIDGFVDEEGALSVSLTYSRSTFDEAYVGKKLLKLDGPELAGVTQDQLNQDIYNLFAKYMINAKLSALISIPYIVGTSEGMRDLFNGERRVSGIQDITAGLRYNFHTFKFENSDLILLSGFTLSVPFDYESNGFLSIGTGALAADFTGGIQYLSDDGFFTILTAAYSFKDDADAKGVFTDIPNSFLAGAKIGYSTRSIYVSGWVDYANAIGGADVNLTNADGFQTVDENMNPVGNFPETEVEYLRAGVVIQKSLSDDINLSVGYGKVLNGRNVGKSDIYSVGLTYNVQLL
ncbi:hypothetical protein ACXGQW_05755 [Wenyingzhuangia sp. IMCC45533]